MKPGFLMKTNKVARIFLAANYETMFNSLLKDAQESGKGKRSVTTLQNSIKKEIQWAKKDLQG